MIRKDYAVGTALLVLGIWFFYGLYSYFAYEPTRSSEQQTPEVRLSCGDPWDQNWSVFENPKGVIIVIPVDRSCQTTLVLIPTGKQYTIRPLGWIQREREYDNGERGEEEWDGPGIRQEPPKQWVRGFRFRNDGSRSHDQPVKVFIVPN